MALYRIFHRNSLPNSFTRHMMNLTPRKSSVPLKTIEIPVVFKQIHSELEVQNGGRNGKLLDMATYYFDGQGKAIRPSIVVNMGSAICAHLDRDSEKIFNSHMKIAKISEMIHTASLVHDDIVDHAELRRGKASINSKWNDYQSAHCANFILATSTKILASMEDAVVLKLMSQIIEDLVKGEFLQMKQSSDLQERFKLYIDKSYYKTASLMAYSCQSVAVATLASDDIQMAAFDYGKNLGLAFQITDDILDFESSGDIAGKATGADLKLGLATAPVLYAAEEFPNLNKFIKRGFQERRDIEETLEAVEKSKGLERSKLLAQSYVTEALGSLRPLKESKHKAKLVNAALDLMNRNK